MKLKNKLISGCLFLSFLILVSGGTGIFFMKSIEKNFNHLTSVYQNLVIMSSVLLSESRKLNVTLSNGLKKTDFPEIDSAITKVRQFENLQKYRLIEFEYLARKVSIDIDLAELNRQQETLSTLAIRSLTAHKLNEKYITLEQKQISAFQALYKATEQGLKTLSGRADSLMSSMSDRSRTLIQSRKGGISEYEKILNHAFEQTYPKVSVTLKANNYLIKMLDLVNEYNRRENPVELAKIEKSIQKIALKIKSLIKRLKVWAIQSDEFLITNLASNIEKIEHVLTADTGYFVLRRKSIEANQKMYRLKDELTSSMDVYETHIHSIVETTDYQNQIVKLAMEKDAVLAISILSAIVFIGLVISVAFGIFFSSKISTPITKITTAMRKLADGDMSVPVEFSQEKNEIGELARALAFFKESAIEQRHLKRKAKKIAEEALKNSEIAISANKAKTDFLANMSHELRTPLNAIIGFSDVIKERRLGKNVEDKYLEYANDIHMAGLHLLSLINDILDLAKAESGTETLNENYFEVEQTVKNVVKIVAELGKSSKIDVVVENKNKRAVLYADERKVKQILLNLLSNAIKFTPEGGKVTLKLASKSDNSFVIDVIDTGIGIAENDFLIVMTPFEQIDNGLNRKYEGTGLGLSLAKLYTEMHGGSLEMQSEVGVGTKFSIVIPAERVTKLKSKTITPIAKAPQKETG